MTNGRASIFDDDGPDLGTTTFTTKPRGANRPDASAVRAVAESAGFPSREPSAPVADRPRRAAPRTGRNMQLNVKISREYLDRFLLAADQLGLSQAETLERSIESLERQLSRGD